jgi:hypothetical protein
MNWKGCGNGCSISKVLFQHSVGGTEGDNEDLVKMSGIRAKNRTRELRNMKQA